MDKTNQRALEAAVSYGFRKGDFTSLAHALLGECEQRTHVQEQIKEQVAAVSQAVTDITNEDFVEFAAKRQALQGQLDAANNELASLKAELAGDEDGVLRIQTLYVG